MQETPGATNNILCRKRPARGSGAFRCWHLQSQEIMLCVGTVASVREAADFCTGVITRVLRADSETIVELLGAEGLTLCGISETS